jgi:hypothetical protein
MSLSSMLTKPVDVLYSRVVGKDEFGQPRVQETAVRSKCYYRLQNTMVGDAVYQTEERIKVMLPADTSLDGLKGVKIDSTVYETAGVPHLQWNPRTQSNQYLLLQVRKAAS